MIIEKSKLFSPYHCFMDVLLLLPSCLPKRQIVYERRIPPSEKREVKKEVIQEERAITAKTDIDRVEKRETRGVQYGIASWYGPDFHGKPTSSGEIYDMYQLTCAHNALALGTTVIVTNLENGKSLSPRSMIADPLLKRESLTSLIRLLRFLEFGRKGQPSSRSRR